MELGQKITITSILKRRSEYRYDNKISDYKKTEFKTWMEEQLKAPIEVVVVGVRTLSNGYNIWESDIGNVFFAQSHFKALLVVKNLRSKPFFVTPTNSTGR